MNKLRKILIWILIAISSLYLVICCFFYFFQEKFIFLPDKLDENYVYNFQQEFEEISVETKDGIILNSLLFKADNPKGLIFYLHGNAGALNLWGSLAPLYTNDLGYDLFILDYRSFGKSKGKIESEAQLFDDIQAAYNKMKERYNEDQIVVLGYSIGTCPATWLASVNNPRMLILQAPYYSLTGVIQNISPVIPEFLIRYKLETYKYIEDCRMPIVIFHGDLDKIINYSNSLHLKKLLKPTDRLITLEGEGHNEITDNKQYRTELSNILF